MPRKKKVYKPIKCHNCKEIFTPTRWWNRFCSNSCRYEKWENENPRASSRLGDELEEVKERLAKLEKKDD